MTIPWCSIGNTNLRVETGPGDIDYLKCDNCGYLVDTLFKAYTLIYFDHTKRKVSTEQMWCRMCIRMEEIEFRDGAKAITILSEFTEWLEKYVGNPKLPQNEWWAANDIWVELYKIKQKHGWKQ